MKVKLKKKYTALLATTNAYQRYLLVFGGNHGSCIHVDQNLRIWLGTQFSWPTPELGPLQAEF